MSERKKDEHDNLLNALREMQSEGTTQERIGKLYFIIMLSRWQEASINKKYEQVLTEVKQLREELYNMEVENCRLDDNNQELVAINEKLNQENEMHRGKDGFETGQQDVRGQLNEMSQRLMDLVDNLTESEYLCMMTRQQLREEREKNTNLQAQAEYA